MVNEKSVLAVVSARATSTRLPGKVLLPLFDGTVLDVLIHRLRKSNKVSDVVIAIPETPQNNLLADYLGSKNYPFIRGEEEDVLGRFIKAIAVHDSKYVLRVTADCPLIDAEVVDALIDLGVGKELDYCFVGRSFPHGLDVEFLTRKTVMRLQSTAQTGKEREHVTSTLRSDSNVRWESLHSNKYLGDYRLTLDFPEDYLAIQKVINGLQGIDFNFEQLVEFLGNHEPEEMPNYGLVNYLRP